MIPIWPFVSRDRRIASLKRQRDKALAEINRLRSQNADLSAANDTFRALIDRHKGIAEANKAELEREKRLRAAHEGQCPTAAAIADEDRAKRSADL